MNDIVRSAAAAVAIVLLAGAALGCGARPSADGSDRLVYAVGTENGSARAGLFLVDDDGGNRVRLTSTPPSAVSYAEWSPKGGTILFESQLEAEEEVWTIEADGSDLHQVGRGGGALWSPDGREIAVLVPTDELRIVTKQGEHRRTIRLGLRRDQFPDVGGEWSPDGSEIAIDVLEGGGESRVAIVAADGSGPARLLGEPKPGVSEASPAWSPDGKAIAFIRVNEDASDGNEIWVMRPDGSGRRRITGGAEEARWSQDGRSLLFSASYPRAEGLYRVSLSGGEALRIGPQPARALVDRPREPGGTRVLHYDDGRLSVSRADGSGKRILTAPYEDAAPLWSPDGAHIAFTRGNEVAERWDVHVIGSDGGSDRRVCRGGFPFWLPDGRLLVERDGGFAFEDVDPQQISVPVEGTNRVVSPDGELIAFVRNRSVPGPEMHGEDLPLDVQSTLYVRSWDGRRERALAKTPGTEQAPIVFSSPVWAPDGRSILIEEHDPLGGGSSRIRQVPVAEGEPRTVASDEGSDLEYLSVAPDGERIAFATETGIDVVDLVDGERKTVVPFEIAYSNGVEWAPDGEKLAYVVSHPESESVFELYVVDADGSHRRRVSKPGDAVSGFDFRPAPPGE